MTRPVIDLHHPRPFDIVDNPVVVAGIGVATEGVIGRASLQDEHGALVGEARVDGVGGMGFTNFSVSIPLTVVPAGPRGTLVIQPDSLGDTSRPAVYVPVVFGAALKPDYLSFQTYTVARGDTLSGIAASHGLTGWHVLFEANRDVVHNPNVIFPGQELRIPL